MYTLNDICLLITDGSHFSPEDEGIGYPMLSVKDMYDDYFDTKGCKHVGEDAFQKLVANGCNPQVNDVVVAKDGSFLKTAFTIKEKQDIVLLSSIAILRPKLDIIVPDYLSYFLKSDSVYRTVSLNYISGTALKRIILKGLKKIPIEVPKLEEQQHRVNLLNALQMIIKQRREELLKLDELIKARFVELFGVPETNPKGWEQVTVGDVCSSIVRGPFGSALKKEFFVEPSNKTYKVYEQKHAIQKNATIGTYYVTEEKYQELKRFECVPGDIIMSCSGTMGELYQLPEGCERGIINQALCKFTLNDKMLPVCFLTYMRQTIGNLETKGSGIKNIAAVSYVKAMPINLPPKQIQKEYEFFYKQVEKSKAAVQKALDETQLLFDSLMQKYFG